MPDKRQTRGPTPLQQTFPPACAATFDAIMAGHGFAREEATCEPHQCTQQYVAGKRYIEITANLDLRDIPFYCNLTLGEGRTDWPERDWNGIGLWRLIREREPERADGGEYPLSSQERVASELGPILERLRDDLLRYAGDFLEGNLGVFRRVRAAQTIERMPYLIHMPDGQGGYISTFDPESAALKERFSHEDVS